MAPRHLQGGRCCVLVALTAAAALLPAGTVAAQDLAKHAESLKFVPADVSAYSVMLRNGEQIQAMLKSKAWAKLNALPVVKMAWQALEQQLHQDGGPLEGFRRFHEQPDNKKLVKLLAEMVKDEIFVASGRNVTQLIELAMNVSAANQFAPLLAQLQGQNPDLKARVKLMLQAVADDLDKIVIPEMIVGFRLKDNQSAEAQLQRLEILGKVVTAGNPLLQGRFQKKQIDGKDFLTLNLDGKMIPWDMVPIADFEDNPGEFDKLVKKLKNLKLTVSLGLRDNFLVLSIADSTAMLERFGQGQRLAERTEIQRLAKFADQKVIEISYTSKELQGSQTTRPEDVQDMAKWVTNLLKSAGLTPEQEAKIRKDLKKLDKDLKGYLAEPGAQASIGFLTGRGAESYSFDWTKNTRLDGTRPLTLLHHLGSSPLLAVVSREKYVPEDYAQLVKWIKVAHGYFEEFAIPKLDQGAQDIYKQVMTSFAPLFKRLNKATGEMLLPALADGQVAFVLDAKLKSKQWHMLMPEAEKPLPLLEPALVLGVKDADLLRKALEEYRDIANKAFEAIGQILPIPIELKIPEPDSKKISEGTLYSYSIPEIVMLDPQIKPTGGLSEKVATLTISHEHAIRLLKKSSLKPASPLLADAKKPLTAAVHFDFAGVVRSAGPWVEMILQSAGVAGDGEDAPLQQVRAVMEILTVLRSYTSISYFEDGALVTRGETIIRDLPEARKRQPD
jgi:hypothetical protein